MVTRSVPTADKQAEHVKPGIRTCTLRVSIVARDSKVTRPRRVYAVRGGAPCGEAACHAHRCRVQPSPYLVSAIDMPATDGVGGADVQPDGIARHFEWCGPRLFAGGAGTEVEACHGTPACQGELSPVVHSKSA